MMFAISALEGCAVGASDGQVGTVKDILFDDEAWRIRWGVVDTGTWLTGRKVLVHPSAIEPLALEPQRRLPMMGAVPEITLSVASRRELAAIATSGEPTLRILRLGPSMGRELFWR